MRLHFVARTFYFRLPKDPDVVVFYNGIKALNIRGWFWLWRQVFTGNLIDVTKAAGCIEAKLSICSPQEAIIVSYWQDEASLTQFFRSPLHREMMKSTKELLGKDLEAISLFNETYRPLRSGMYLNEPQGLAKIYPAVQML